MPQVYCPSSTCAARIPYEAIKPTTCPRCKQPFAAAFKTTVAAAPASVAPTPVVRPKRAIPATPAMAQSALKWKAKNRPQAKSAAIVDDDIEAQFGVTGEEDEGEGDNVMGQRDPVRDLASELAASIDPSTIHIGEPRDDSVFRLSQGGLISNPAWEGPPRIERLD